MGVDYAEKIEEIVEILIEHYDLETLHHHDFFLSDLEDGIEHFVDKNFISVITMLQEGGHIG